MGHLASLLVLMLTNTVSKSILDKARSTLNFGQTTERPLGVLALKLWSTVMDTGLTLINIWMKTSQKNFLSTRYERQPKKTADQCLPTNSRDLCSCCCQWAHILFHSWLLSGNGTNPPCWCNALLPDNCWLPPNIRWYLRKNRIDSKGIHHASPAEALLCESFPVEKSFLYHQKQSWF